MNKTDFAQQFNPSTPPAWAKSVISRILKGDPRHRSRLHDFEGNRATRGLARSVMSTAFLKLGHRQQVPWLNYPAISRLKSILRPDSRVLEFGSGFSTQWLSKRCSEVVSIESDPVWFKKLVDQVSDNVDLRLCVNVNDYCNLADIPDRHFDLAIVDGAWRDTSMLTALTKVKIGGRVYLDNSDVPDAEHQNAKRLLLNATRDTEVLVGMTPFQVTTTQGILGRVCD